MLSVRDARAMANRGTSDLPLLSRLDRGDLRALARVARRRRFGTGEVIFAEGEPADALYLVTSGEVGLFARSPSGREALVRTLRSGDSFGDMSVLAGTPRTLTAVATTPSSAVFVGGPDLEQWLLGRPGAAVALLEVLSLRLQRMTVTLSDMLVVDLSHRVAKLLLTLVALGRMRGNDGRIGMTQAELGLRLGVSRESVNKILRRFAREGWVELARGSVVVTQEAALHAYLDDMAAPDPLVAIDHLHT